MKCIIITTLITVRHVSARRDVKSSVFIITLRHAHTHSTVIEKMKGYKKEKKYFLHTLKPFRREPLDEGGGGGGVYTSVNIMPFHITYFYVIIIAWFPRRRRGPIKSRILFSKYALLLLDSIMI